MVLATGLERDTETQRVLTERGWTVVVVWEHDDPQEAADRVAAAVLDRRVLHDRLRAPMR